MKRTWKTWHLAVGCLIALLIGIGIGGASRDKPQAAGITVVTVPVTEPGAASKPSVTTTATVPKATTTTAPATTTTQRPATTTAPPTTTTRAPSETVSQKNARQKAGEYLSYTSFSRSGLISQLKFEGFTEADATYGVDARNVDWNQQAEKKAKDYLSYTSFSRSGLISQLRFEGFTQAEAEHGVSATGL